MSEGFRIAGGAPAGERSAMVMRARLDLIGHAFFARL
jgi:hypothetical protein